MTTDYEEYLRQWIGDFLNKPQPLLNNLPSCPFAEAALLQNKVKFQRSSDYVGDIEQVFLSWDSNIDVVVVVCDDDVDPDKFVEEVEKINKQYVPLGYACLEDHIKLPETIKGVIFNNGRYNLILCQRLDKLNSAYRYLETLGYYTNWDKDYFDSVVSWRLPKTS